jgi:hypothetical protein
MLLGRVELMTMPAQGSTEWFEMARQRCVDHLRALASVRMADAYVAELLDDAHDPNEVNSALHNAAVTAYAQAFTEARTHGGGVQYQTRPLKRATGFDSGLHDHLMNLRNELIAHADYTVLPPAMDMHRIGNLAVAITVKAKRLAGIQSRTLAERYRRHFRACMEIIEKLLNDDLQELAGPPRRISTRLMPRTTSRPCCSR